MTKTILTILFWDTL